MQDSDGILVPGGFGDRGVQGKILAAKYARENGVPFLGICLGLQIAVIEFARSVSFNFFEKLEVSRPVDRMLQCVLASKI